MPLQMRGGTGGIISSLETNNSLLTTLINEDSGNKSVNWRLGTSTNHSAFGLTSTRENIDNTQFWCNEMGIPINSLDITLPTAAVILGIASTSASDAGGGVGANAIQIVGLDSDYNDQSEIIVLTGTTEVASTLSYIAVNNAIVVAVGSTGWNVGTIYIGGTANDFTGAAGTGVGAVGTPDTDVYRTIGVSAVDGKGMGASNTSTYTIKAGFTGVPLSFLSSNDATATKPLLIRGIFKPFGLGELTVGNLAFNGSQLFTFDGFPAFGEKTSLIIRTRAKTATSVDLCALFWEWNMVNNNALP